MSFWGELKRRKVVQVSAVYAVVAWLLVQVVATIKQPLSLPPWFDTVVLILLAVGFPIAVILAWAFDLGPGGIAPTGPEAREPRLGPAPGAFSNVVQILILAAVGFFLLATDPKRTSTSLRLPTWNLLLTCQIAAGSRPVFLSCFRNRIRARHDSSLVGGS